jgi:hypothetical protein
MTFLVRGADGVDYPADLETMRSWLAEGRIAREQYVYDQARGAWTTVGALIERPAAPPAAAPARSGRLVLGCLGIVLVLAIILLARTLLRRGLQSEAPAVAQKTPGVTAPPRALPLDQWVNDGPEGAEIFHFAVNPANPDIVLAGSAQYTAFRSTDGGATWKRVLREPTLDLSAVAFSPDGARAFIAGDDGVFVSADGGATFALNAQLGDVTVNSVAAGSSGSVYIATEEGFFSSSDGGARWTARKRPIASQEIRLKLMPGSPDRLYASTLAGIFESADGARSWKPLPFPDKGIREIEVVPPATIHAATVKGLVRSTDGGKSWAALARFAGERVYEVRVAGDRTVFAQTDNGYFRSDDGGETWNELAPTAGVPIRTLGLSRTTLHASSFDDRLYASADGGKTWTTASAGLTGAKVIDLETLSGGRVVTHSATQVAVASRTEGWREVVRAAKNSMSESIVGISASGGHLYVARGADARATERSDDRGRTWKPWGGDIEATRLMAQPGSSRMYAATKDGLSVSVDDGATWQSLASGFSVEELLFGNGRMHARTFDGEIKSSTDEGRTWRNEPRIGTVNDIDLTADGVLCASHSEGLSCLRGARFERADEGLPEDAVTAVAAHPTKANILLAGSSLTGVSVSRDGGKSWSAFFPNGGPMHVTRIVFDREDPSYVHVATEGESVYSIRTNWE